MIFALDTVVVSEPRKARPHGAVESWYAAHPISHYAIPAIVFYELQKGALKTRRQDRAKANEIDLWIQALADRAIILPFTATIARETARLLEGKSLALFEDACIAATARIHDLTIATRNTKDFRHFDVPLVNPFLYERT